MDKDNLIQKKLGQNVKRIRLSKCMTQEKLADVCGVHQHYISDLELGKRNITIGTLDQIAMALNVSAKSLLNDKRMK